MLRFSHSRSPTHSRSLSAQRAQMPQAAPGVLRCESVVAHCSDPSAVEAALAAMNNFTSSRVAAGHEEPTTGALHAFESAMSAARDAGLGSTTGAIVHSLPASGHEHLATRLRNAARSRGAVAHPDASLSSDILSAG